MTSLFDLRRYLETRKDVALDAIRVYLGVGLIVKGLAFLSHAGLLVESMHQAGVSWGAGILGHYVVLAHVCGGFLLAVGLFTRLAALVNVPVLFGAAFLVHSQGGLFTAEQTLEFALLVLFLLVVFTVAGAGRFSLDAYVARHDVLEPRRA